MNTTEKCDKSSTNQSEDARRDDKIESMKPAHTEHDGSCGCDMSDVKSEKEGTAKG